MVQTQSGDEAGDENASTSSRRIRRRTQEKRRADEGAADELIDSQSSTAAATTADALPAGLTRPLAGSLSSTSQPVGETFQGDESTAESEQRAFTGDQQHAAASQPQASSSEANTTSEEDGRDRFRSRIARAISSGTATGRFAAVQDFQTDSARPTMLSALLSDILGLRGSRAGSDGADTPAQHGRTDDANARAGNGGTSVIVQGALVSRTVPGRSTAPDANAGRDSGTQPASPSSGQASHTTNPDPLAGLGGQEDTSMNGNASDAQAATIEEQASMLVRLLSIATAATAASLLSGPSSTQPQGSPTTEGFGNATSPSRDASSADQSSVSPHDEHMTTSTTTVDAPPTSQPRPPSLASTSTSSSAWATQTLQSLRSRISSIGNRLRGRRATISTSEPARQSSRLASEPSARAPSTDHTAEAATSGQPARQQSPMSTASSRQHEDDHVPTLATLSNMLRDAIRDGIQGSSRSSRNSRSSTSPRRSNPSEASDVSRARSVNATLEAVRGGQLTPGDEGTFNRFLYDLSNDLNAAVRGLPDGSTADHTDNSSEALDESTRSRRQRDTQGGQLSFFRFFTFPEPHSRQASNSGVSPPSLLPCIVVGVRSLEASGNGAAERSAESVNRPGMVRDPDGQTATSTPVERQDPPMQPDYGRPLGPEVFMQNGPGSPPMSRFLLFVSGGHYPPQHPLFHASNDEASRDLMVLMEFLGAMAAVQMKPNNTVTQDQIAKSKLRVINGSRTEIETLTKLHQVMENTSERCLICLEDWTDDDGGRRLLDCGHLFHAPCLDQWLVGSNNSCPLCRRQAVSTEASPPSSADAPI